MNAAPRFPVEPARALHARMDGRTDAAHATPRHNRQPNSLPTPPPRPGLRPTPTRLTATGAYPARAQRSRENHQTNGRARNAADAALAASLMRSVKYHRGR
ncbi:hypothetical protein [Verminephrobacter aporrectodeae]|uniref:hypothetical protein n=1 Tax=Verminephrobacter aporrectodeae TaxID=1110389 RepID=UPI002244437B|nr:hypothetical protein [Verminephrobacter aporrectodeae]